MTQQTIEIKGLPEGWKAVAYRAPIMSVDYVFDNHSNEVILCEWGTSFKSIIVEKIQPRKIVLEETDEVASIHEFQAVGDDKGYPKILFKSDKIWREVKE